MSKALNSFNNELGNDVTLTVEIFYRDQFDYVKIGLEEPRLFTTLDITRKEAEKLKELLELML